MIDKQASPNNAPAQIPRAERCVCGRPKVEATEEEINQLAKRAWSPLHECYDTYLDVEMRDVLYDGRQVTRRVTLNMSNECLHELIDAHAFFTSQRTGEGEIPACFYGAHFDSGVEPGPRWVGWITTPRREAEDDAAHEQAKQARKKALADLKALGGVAP